MKRINLEPLFLRMCSGQATSTEDLAAMARLTDRAITQPQHPAMDLLWRKAYKRARLAEAMREASHWRIRAMATMLDDPAEYLCPHLTQHDRCSYCQPRV